MKRKIDTELIGTRLIVWDTKSGMELYRSGFYGKPVGIPKPKPDKDFKVPLMLDLMEGLYLFENGKIKVTSPGTGKKLKKSTLLSRAKRTYRRFELAYTVYKDLRKKGYIVTPGIKFGADFAVYERGPGIDHAPFIVSVKTNQEKMGTFDVVRAGRLATTVRKQFVVATPAKKNGEVNYLIFSWFKA